MGEPAMETGDHFTYGQYRRWPEDERWELLRGSAWSMAGGARTVHQRASGRLHRRFSAFFDGKPCEVFLPPFDIVLADDEAALEDADTVVQPDLTVLCDPGRFFDRGYRGAPPLVVEILSPSTARKDLHEKFSLYEEFGVAEYWVVDPAAQTVLVFHRTAEGRFDRGELTEGSGEAVSRVFPGLTAPWSELFA